MIVQHIDLQWTEQEMHLILKSKILKMRWLKRISTKSSYEHQQKQEKGTLKIGPILRVPFRTSTVPSSWQHEQQETCTKINMQAYPEWKANDQSHSQLTPNGFLPLLFEKKRSLPRYVFFQRATFWQYWFKNGALTHWRFFPFLSFSFFFCIFLRQFEIQGDSIAFDHEIYCVF